MVGQGRKRPRGGFREKKQTAEPEFRMNDVYEAEDSDPDEDKKANQRYDRVENYEYELPADFEDEEIDEDEAFNSEDERMYGHLFAGRGRGKKAADFDAEEEEEEVSGSEDDLLDSEEDGGETEEEDSELEEVFGRTGDGGPFNEVFGEEEEEEGGEAVHDAMLRAVTGGAAGAASRDSQQAKRRRRDHVVTESHPESEYNLPASGAAGELTLADLIAGLGDSRAKLGPARKTLERLEKKAAPVAAPLPGPVRQRQERKAGYEASKKNVAKWMPLVKAHREAPTLHFKADVSGVPRTVTTASLVAKHEPETAMEAEVAALLQAAGAQTAAAVAEAEDALALKALTVAEAQERRERLAKMRALLFYHEVKSKRLKKIKSKEYRRRLKKAEKRKAAGGELDGELLDDDALRKEQEDAEYERAKERLTLKHKNTSRFIRRALKRGGQLLDDGTKEAVEEQLRLGQELRSRVHRLGAKTRDSDTEASDDDGEESSEEESGSEDEARGGLSSKARAAAMDLLQGGNGGEGALPTHGIFALPFMQREMGRRRAEAQEEARALLELEEGTAAAAARSAAAAAAGGLASGRVAFGGSADGEDLAQQVRQLEAAALASDSEGDEREDVEAKAERLARTLRGKETTGSAAEQLQQQRFGRKSGGSGGGGVLGDVARQKATIAGQDRLFGSGAAVAAADGNGGAKVTANGGGVSIGPASFKGGKGKKGGAAVVATVGFLPAMKFSGAKSGFVFKSGPSGVGYYPDGPAGSAAAAAAAAKKAAKESLKKKSSGRPVSAEDEAQLMRPEEGAVAAEVGLTQEELVQRAFAGDDVLTDFAAEKAAEVEAELPPDDAPGALPGWGTWGLQREPRWAVEARSKAKAARAAAAASRQDAALRYVVISEKWDKRNAKYRTPTVPFPFDSKDTYERTMRQPLGRDFNTNAAFRDLTRPEVVKDAGVIIQPIRFSAAAAEHAAAAGTGAHRAPVLTVEGGMAKRAKKIPAPQQQQKQQKKKK